MSFPVFFRIHDRSFSPPLLLWMATMIRNSQNWVMQLFIELGDIFQVMIHFVETQTTPTQFPLGLLAQPAIPMWVNLTIVWGDDSFVGNATLNKMFVNVRNTILLHSKKNWKRRILLLSEFGNWRFLSVGFLSCLVFIGTVSRVLPPFFLSTRRFTCFEQNIHLIFHYTHNSLHINQSINKKAFVAFTITFLKNNIFDINTFNLLWKYYSLVIHTFCHYSFRILQTGKKYCNILEVQSCRITLQRFLKMI